MTKSEYEMYDEVMYRTNNQLVICGRRGTEITEWKLDEREGEFYHKKA